jgi:hypothetical protein
MKRTTLTSGAGGVRRRDAVGAQLFLGRSLIQSVVQAGARRVTTRAAMPAGERGRTSSSICPIAGQPL